MKWSGLVLVRYNTTRDIANTYLQVLILSLSSCGAFSWNFFFGTDYMGKTFLVQRDPHQGYINREAGHGDTESQRVDVKSETSYKNKKRLTKYIRSS